MNEDSIDARLRFIIDQIAMQCSSSDIDKYAEHTLTIDQAVAAIEADFKSHEESPEGDLKAGASYMLGNRLYLLACRVAAGRKYGRFESADLKSQSPKLRRFL